MIDAHTYLLFIGAVVVLVIAPGPDMAYFLARTLAQGRRAGAVAVLGINLGAYVHVAAAVLGLSAILATSSLAFTMVKWAGAAYLIWIGVQAILSRAGPLQLDGRAQTELNGRAIFWQGFLCDVLNPKVALFFLTFLPQFVRVDDPAASGARQLLVLGITCNVVALAINLVFVQLASVATRRLRTSGRLVTWLNRTMGAVFIGLGIRLGYERM